MSINEKKIFDLPLFKRLLDYVKPYRFVFVSSLVFVVALSFFGALRPYVLQQAIDVKITNEQYDGFVFYVIIMLALLVLEVVSQLLFIYYANWLGQFIVKDIRVKLFKHMLNFKRAYFDKSSVGILITRVVMDMERIADIFGQGLFMIFSDALKMVVVAGFMVYINPMLSLMVFFTLPFTIVATRIFQRYMKRAFEDVRTEISNLNSFVQERVTGMKILQLFSRENTEYKKFTTINERHKKAWLKTVLYNSIFFPVAEFISSLTLAFIVLVGGFSIISDNSFTSIGQLVAFTMFVPMLFRPLHQIANKFNTLQMGMVAANRVFKILDTTSHINDNGTLEAKPFKGNINFENVKFAYTKDELVLKGISFSIKSGETVAIAGATGAGKSTIINLLNRFYDIDEGAIKIDGTDIRAFKLKEIRQQIAMVLQDVFLFADTILNNITLNDTSISKTKVIEAAKAIGIHEFISSLPGGYHYNVKERGVMLSSGQRQLIAFLRAYVVRPSILILDEATSSVDGYSEQLIQYATNKITKDRTSIIIAHRLSTIQKADKILVMDDGHIVEIGTHKNLIKKEDGYYRNLYQLQFLNAEVV